MSGNGLEKAVHQTWKHYLKYYEGPDPSRGLQDAQDAWENVEKFMKIPRINDPLPRQQAKDESIRSVETSVHTLKQKRWMSANLNVFHDILQTRESELKATINHYMYTWKSTRSTRDIYLFINRLAEIHTLWCSDPVLGPSYPGRYHHSFVTMVHSMLPDFFPDAFRDLLKYAVTNRRLPSEANGPDFPDCTFPHPNLSYLPLQYPNSIGLVGPPSRYVPLFSALDILGFLERYEAQLIACINDLIEDRIHKTCRGIWGAQLYPGLKQWLLDCIVPWIMRPYARGLANPDEAWIIAGNVLARLEHHLSKTLCNIRMSELFDIIVDFPNSIPALLDIRECLTKVNYRLELVKALRKLNNRRLLHPGADTKDILTQYVSTIRCLRVIDPPGVLLYKVADPIRRYLRVFVSERPDTIRNIVSSLVGEGSDLVDEHEQAMPFQQSGIDDYFDPNWEPEPIDAGPEFRANRPTDVLTTLVSIYDSGDLFVKELQILLAQRLLVISDGNDDRERRTIEILKLRFGDAALQVCEVMLRDMSESRRIDQHIQSQNRSVIHPIIMSTNFWPSLQASSLKMPGRFQKLQETYSQEYEIFKPDKKLRWLPHLGSMQLEIELQDRKIETEATPLEAAILELFSEKDVWTVEELLPELGSVDQAPMIRALNVWIDKGVLIEEGAHYRLLEISQESGSHEPLQRFEEESPGIIAMRRQQAEQMQIYWKFIQGMLTNLGALPLDRINRTLRVLVPGYDLTPEQLFFHLESAKREKLVIVKDGLWSLTSAGKIYG